MDPAALARLALLSAILAVSGANGSTSAPANPTIGAATNATYIVQTGDTLFSIALKFDTTVDAIQKANNITNPNTLAVGQRLVIPGTNVAQNAATPSPPPSRPPPRPPRRQRKMKRTLCARVIHWRASARRSVFHCRN